MIGVAAFKRMPLLLGAVALCGSMAAVAAAAPATQSAAPATRKTAEAPPTTRRVLDANALSLELADFDAAAGALARSMLDSPGVKDQFVAKDGRKPLVMFSRFRNDTPMKANMLHLLGWPLAEAIMTDGRALPLLDEDPDQARMQAALALVEQKPARIPEFLLHATVTTLRTAGQDGKREAATVFQATLSNVSTGEPVWMGRHTVVKVVKE